MKRELWLCLSASILAVFLILPVQAYALTDFEINKIINVSVQPALWDTFPPHLWLIFGIVGGVIIMLIIYLAFTLPKRKGTRAPGGSGRKGKVPEPIPAQPMKAQAAPGQPVAPQPTQAQPALDQASPQPQSSESPPPQPANAQPAPRSTGTAAPTMSHSPTSMSSCMTMPTPTSPPSTQTAAATTALPA